MGLILNGSALQPAALNGLSQPLHLFEYLTRSQHYHFGFFEGRETRLPEAMEQLAERSAMHFRRHARVLDVGCALGGTSRLLGKRGCEVVGIDPCPDAIEYARSHSDKGIRFFCERLGDFTRRPQKAFDGIVLIEVLQYFRSLEELVARCRELLGGTGLVVVNDIVKSPDLQLAWVPYPERGALVRIAEAAGFETIVNEDVSPWVTPTLPRLVERLESQRNEIEGFFSSDRPGVKSDVDELLDQLDLLRQGFAEGHLAYETTVLRRAGV